MERGERRAHVVDELERLRHDRAVERVVRDVRRVGEVADDRRLGVALLRHQDVDCARRRVRSASCSPAPRSRARGRGCRRRASRRTARRRRGRSACRARSPSSGRSASCDAGRRATEGVGAATRRTLARTGRSRVRTACGTKRRLFTGRPSGKGAIIRRRGRLPASPEPRAADRRRLPAPRRRRALARRVDGVVGAARRGRRAAHRPRVRSGLEGAGRRMGLDAAASRQRANPRAGAPRGGSAGVRRARRVAGVAALRERGLRAPRRRDRGARRRPARARGRRHASSSRASRSATPITPGSAELLAGALGTVACRRATPSSRTRVRADVRSGRGARLRAGRRHGCDDRIAKWRAIRRYASQLPLLAMRRSLRRGAHRYAATPEWIAWGPDYPSTSA